MRTIIITTIALNLAACSSDAPAPMFPADYADTYVEVRNCRQSSDHDFRRIRILAGPTALEPYNTRQGMFPVDAIVIKEEYEFGDDNCAGPIIEWTAMQRTDGVAQYAWSWQRVSPERKVTDDVDSIERCINCHAACGVPPDGFDGTCALP